MSFPEKSKKKQSYCGIFNHWGAKLNDRMHKKLFSPKVWLKMKFSIVNLLEKFISVELKNYEFGNRKIKK